MASPISSGTSFGEALLELPITASGDPIATITGLFDDQTLQAQLALRNITPALSELTLRARLLAELPARIDRLMRVPPVPVTAAAVRRSLDDHVPPAAVLDADGAAYGATIAESRQTIADLLSVGIDAGGDPVYPVLTRFVDRQGNITETFAWMTQDERDALDTLATVPTPAAGEYAGVRMRTETRPGGTYTFLSFDAQARIKTSNGLLLGARQQALSMQAPGELDLENGLSDLRQALELFRVLLDGSQRGATALRDDLAAIMQRTRDNRAMDELRREDRLEAAARERGVIDQMLGEYDDGVNQRLYNDIDSALRGLPAQASGRGDATPAATAEATRIAVPARSMDILETPSAPLSALPISAAPAAPHIAQASSTALASSAAWAPPPAPRNSSREAANSRPGAPSASARSADTARDE
jgi:hypothetical protein